ncbi:FAD binding domain-containing protein [Colletotrichum simmondsii]|uniref:FAD binding domain-containing protein n=1 Tax=Colletotrichum simmondsii TaxID=703756 RepID=A0A135S2V9_9PEZI|nr:FAD binding domain-containing protein [Colletotrichum simmondsii]
MLLPFLLPFLAGFGTVTAQPATTQDVCNTLGKLYADSTILPGTSRYDFENTYSWTSTAWLGPACVFAPTSAEDVSVEVKLFTQANVPFAVRAGGGMTVDNAANIGPEGILISSTNMTMMDINDDHSLVSVGPGIRWPQFYAYLDNFNRTVDGIRLGNVGVVGLLLGGGIGFFSYEHGSVSTEVQAFQCVLANGNIVEASLTENSDLFWALRGGGNNFCIVTRADLRTLDVSAVDIGSVSYGTESQTEYLKSMVDFAHYADFDPKTAVEGQIRWSPSTNPTKTFDAIIFHSGEELQAGPQNFTVPGLINLTAPVLPVTGGEVVRQTMGKWSNAVDYASDAGRRQLWHSVSIPADADLFNIFVDSYFNGIAELANVPGFFTALAIMPITKSLLEKSEGNGANPLVAPGQEYQPQMWLFESASWPDAEDDKTVFDAHQKANEDIKTNIRAAGSDLLPFIFLSAAQKTQGHDVFPGYGQENWQKLKEIRAKYDPNLVFTKLVPGGAKVES